MPATRTPSATPEHKRLEQARTGTAAWKAWGPYLSERQWGTVREDYSADGDAWDYFPHDHARIRAYRWGEDGIAGICDERQRLCLALALWNGARPDPQGAAVRPHQQRGQSRRGRQGVLVLSGRHADSLLPEVLYKYPQRAFPYDGPHRDERTPRASRDWSTNCSTPASSTTTATSTWSSSTPRHAPDDIVMRVTVHNRGPEAATLHLLPQLWFRNTWSWAAPSRSRARGGRPAASRVARATHAELGEWLL